MNFRKIFSILLFTFYLTIPIAVYAENTGTLVTGETSNSLDTDDSRLSDSMNNAGNLVNAFDSMFADMGDTTNTETAKSTSKAVAPLVASIIGFFGILIPLCVLAYTGLELACIFIKPIRPLFGAEGSGSSGGMDGNNGKKVLIPVSEDCIAAISGGGGNSGGGMDSNGGKKGLGDIAISYLKLRVKTIVVCLVTVGLLLTPFGYNIILMVVEIIFNVINKLISFVG